MKQFTMYLFLALMLGCGASAENVTSVDNSAIPAATAEGTDGSPAAADATEAQSAFEDMAFGERKVFMKDVVMPEMKPLFVEKRPDFSCITCHGDNLTEVNYEMPNTLDPLNPNAMPFESEDENRRAAAKFMMETVVPAMAGLLKKEPYNPETQSGFGCFDCHAMAPQ